MLDYKLFYKNLEENALIIGNNAAGGIIVSKDTGKMLLAHRSDTNSWGTWGGMLNPNETKLQALHRELQEETGLETTYTVSPLHNYNKDGFQYQNYIILIPCEFNPKLNWENSNAKWVDFEDLPMPMHYGLEELLFESGDKIKKIVDLIKLKNKNHFKESMDTHPAIHQSANFEISNGFINYIKSVENSSRKGFHNNRWYPYDSVEGGNQTIGYGHKILSQEKNRFLNGISSSEAERLLVQDIEFAKEKVKKDIEGMFHVNVGLDQQQEEMLIDFIFNIGTLHKFPKFTRAVLNKEWDVVKKEYKRNYKDKMGNSHELGRNVDFYNRFLKEDNSSSNEIKITFRGLVGDEIYEYEMKSEKSILKYEFDPTNRLYSLKFIGTMNLNDQHKGYAKSLIESFVKMVKQKNGTIEVDSYTTSGRLYIKHVIEKIADEYKVRVI